LREQTTRELELADPAPFHLAHRLLRSRVTFRHLSVYQVAELEESFDLVFLGTVTTELQDLPRAFEAVRSVTKRCAVVACADLLDHQLRSGWRWVMYHTVRGLVAITSLHDEFPIVRDRPVALYTANDGGAIWRPSVVCIREMLLSAGFCDVDVYSRFSLDNLRHRTQMRHVVFHAFV
jgi:hypothetical protein